MKYKSLALSTCFPLSHPHLLSLKSLLRQIGGRVKGPCSILSTVDCPPILNCCSTKFYIARFRFCSSALYFFRTFLRTFPPLFSTQNLAQSRGPAAYCGLWSVPGGRTLGRRLPGLIHRPAGQVPTQTPGAGENVISGKILSSEDTCMGKLTPPNLKELIDSEEELSMAA